jgi:hypothetical protein
VSIAHECCSPEAIVGPVALSSSVANADSELIDKQEEKREKATKQNASLFKLPLNSIVYYLLTP